MALAAGAVVWWHGFAVLDARPLASKGFRLPFGLGRVTFLCVAKEKSPKERSPPPTRPLRGFPQGRYKVGRIAADGTLAFAIPGFGQSPLRTSLFSRQIGSSCARPFPIWPLCRLRLRHHPDGAPDLAPSPRRTGGGIKIVPTVTSREL